MTSQLVIFRAFLFIFFVPLTLGLKKIPVNQLIKKSGLTIILFTFQTDAMTENGIYTTATRSNDGEENEYLDLEEAGAEAISIRHDKVHFENSRNGPWANQSKEAYSRSTENTTPNSLNEPLSKRALYGFIFTGILLFIVGLLLGILIGYFAIKINSHAESRKDSSSANSKSITGRDLVASTTVFQHQTVTEVPNKQTTNVYVNSSTCICPTTPNVVTTAIPCRVCKRRDPNLKTAGNGESPFAPLSKSEIERVINKLQSEKLVDPTPSIGKNYIDHIYLFPIEKASVLKYLDEADVLPARYAKVHITRGSFKPPDIMIYKIGPVNETIGNMTIDKQVQDGEIHFNRRSYDSNEQPTFSSLFRQHMDVLKDVLKESFDGMFYKKGINVLYSTLYSLDENDRRSGCYLYSRMATGEQTLRILPVSFILHHPGTNTSVWNASDFYYLNQGPFASGQELAEAYKNGSLRRFAFPKGYRIKHAQDFSLTRNQSLPLRENSEIPPPRTYEPEGPRYTVENNVISWMDWQCEFTVHPIKGPAIFNVKFKGTRIAYEISLQDISLVYASGTTGAGVTPPVISDTEFSLGTTIHPSRLGFGCPQRATLLYANVFTTTNVMKKEVGCIFEADAQKPMWRHRKKGLLHHYLVIRSLMNLGNYDYTLEFRFHLDGGIDTTMTSSGLLYGAFWDPEDPLLNDDPLLGFNKSTSPFGFRIGEFLSGPIHTHDFLFKVDLDILGTKNSFQKINWKGGDVLTALRTQKDTEEKPGFFPFNYTRYIDIEYLTKEGGLVLDTLNPSYWTVVNENEKNRWGIKRGYRLIPIFFAGEPVLFTQHLMFGPWLHMKYHAVVTKRKDNEPYGTDSTYDIRRPTDPIGGLINIMNDEEIRNEDLVLWVNAKFVHIPCSEDSPMTMGVERGFTLKPYNYFDTTPTFDIKGHYKTKEPHEKIQCYEP